MEGDRWDRVKRLFEQATRLSGAERERFLEQECAEDGDLRAEVESLLRHDTETGTELAEHGPLHAARWASRPTLAAPARLGPYRLVEPIGEGGMGEVWRAEQVEPVQRHVAIKIVRPGLDSRDVISRFEGERQALARMNHPNVARFFDAGETADGRPYFVMELVDGDTIVRYCERHALPLRRRIALFADACNGVQHAHHKALIHRDLKPSNILVTEIDGQAVPKIIDFGIAKATEAGLLERTMQTQLGMLVGTPAYMSPEQASGDGDIDVRTDVFSLGVVLYQLLTGALPIEPTDASRVSPQHFVERLQTTEPDRPSRRVGDSHSRRALHGELDWITMRALEKDRARRYQSPGELSDDLRRYLAGAAVSAGPPSTWYRLRKTMQRHRALVGGLAATLVVLVAGIVVSTVFAFREATQRREAERAQTDLEAVVEFQSEMLSELDTEGVGDRLFADLRERVRATRQERGERDAEIEAALAAFDASIESVNATDAALQMIDNEILARALGTLDGRFSERPLIAASLRDTIGMTYLQLGLYPQAESAWLAAAETRRQLLGSDHPQTLNPMTNLANLYARQGRYAEAEALQVDVLTTRRQLFGDEHPATLSSLANLARVYTQQERYAEAERHYLEALAGLERWYGANSRELLWTKNNLASLYEIQGRFAEAEPLYVEALAARRSLLGDEHPDTLSIMSNLAVLYQSQGRPAEAEPLHQEILEARRRILGSDHPDTLESMDNLSELYKSLGRFAEATALQLDTMKTRRRVLGADHPDTAMSLFDLACLAALRGDPSAAVDWLRQARDAGFDGAGEVSREFVVAGCTSPPAP